MKCVAYTDVNGLTEILRPNPNEQALRVDEDGAWNNQRPPELVYPGRATPETEDEFVARIQAMDVRVPLVTPYMVPGTGEVIRQLRRAEARLLGLAFTEIPSHVVESSTIPEDRIFRAALRVSGQAFGHDMGAAREIARDLLRACRAELFKTLDGQWMRATARGDAALATSIDAKREQLRNWPQDPRLAACATTAELKATVEQMRAAA